MLPGALDSSTHTAVNDAAQVDQQDTYTPIDRLAKEVQTKKKGDLFGMGQSSLITFSGGVPTVTCSTYQTRTEKKETLLFPRVGRSLVSSTILPITHKVAPGRFT